MLTLLKLHWFMTDMTDIGLFPKTIYTRARIGHFREMANIRHIRHSLGVYYGKLHKYHK